MSDVAGQQVEADAKKFLNIATGKVKSAKIYSVVKTLSEKDLRDFARHSLCDCIIHDVFIDDLFVSADFPTYILVSKLPGVTDDEGVSAQKALCDFLNIPFEFGQHWIFTHEIYYLQNELSEQQLEIIARELLGNPLINRFEFGRFKGKIETQPLVIGHDEVQQAVAVEVAKVGDVIVRMISQCIRIVAALAVGVPC